MVFRLEIAASEKTTVMLEGLQGGRRMSDVTTGLLSAQETQPMGE